MASLGLVLSLWVGCLLSPSGGDQVHRVEIDTGRLRQMADEVGVTSFLDLSSGDGPDDAPAEPMTSDSISALPADVEAGEFEIKCATSCEFVKKGMGQFAGTSGLGGGMGGGNGGEMGLGAQVGRGAMAAADALTDLEMKLQGVQEKLKVSPLDKKLISQEKKLKAQLSAQTLVLQAAAGGGNMAEAPVPQEEAARLASAQSKLRAIEQQLSAGPDNPVLKTERDKLKREVQAKVLAMRSASSVEGKRKQLDDEVSNLSKKLMALRDKATKMPNDATIRKEVQNVQDSLARRAKQANNLSPKEECYRVCVHPSTRPQQQGHDPSHVKNCVRMCVKVMRMLVYKMAKKFL